MAQQKGEDIPIGSNNVEMPETSTTEPSKAKRKYTSRGSHGKDPIQSKLEEQLYKGYGGSARRQPLGDTKRVNIVSPPLCDGILERMKPSLTKHIGCDIIEINPGAGLWSSKLHEFLKPRTHILMEQDIKLYEPMLQPLLDAKDSKYVLVPKPGVIWSHLERVLSEEYLPFQEVLEKNDPRIEQPNDTLLFVANLAYWPKKNFKGFSSVTSLVLHQLMTAVRAKSLFHKYGLVRMLIWVEDEERHLPLPRHISLRKKAAVEAEVSCGKIEEVASSTTTTGIFLRSENLDFRQTRRVLQNMGAVGIEVPEHRRSVVHERLLSDQLSSNLATPAINKNRAGFAYYKELESLEADFAAGRFSRFTDKLRTSDSHIGRPSYVYADSPEWLRMNTLRIIELEKEIFKAKGDTSEMREELSQLVTELKDYIDNFPAEQTRQAAKAAMDNDRAAKDSVLAFMYDRRDVEPLRVFPDEFFPKHQLALLDFHPQPLWPILKQDYQANYDILEFIISTLNLSPGQSTKRALEQLWPGAFEWLLIDCPELQDPFQGGSLDLSIVPVRTLSTRIYKAILESWMRWPWRPDRFEVINRGSAYAGSEDEDPIAGEALGLGS
ncbi:hypothetical protein G7Y89_g2847 [Cudoniella acicularis]|uniref:Mitochondrial transcription factor 1 n=1 Tax=Cudoniella acicularis TaxID=354080 RepID=A0A8H4RUG4_9HELO|nr:hypothetical protein G7Y89_g2847 [Cudoniella acicularis]